MTTYGVIEFIVIALAVGASLNHVLRQYVPGAHRQARRWLSAALGMKSGTAVAAASGCDSGCGACSGCGTTASVPTPEKSGEQPLVFRAGNKVVASGGIEPPTSA